jgi:hypothetical protein
MLPGGRNSGQKSSKGAGGKSWPEKSVAEFWPKFAKSGRKGAEGNCLKEVPYFSVMTNSQRQNKI